MPKRAVAGLLAVGGLHLVAPEAPVALPVLRDVAFLEAGFGQHVLPVLDVHGLLLDRVGVVGAALGRVVVEEGGRQRRRLELGAHRIDDARHVFELAVVGPLGGDLEVEHVAVGHVGRVAGVERGHRLRDHLLRRVQRQLDLDLRILGLELLDRGVQRVVLGLVEALAPPDGELFLREGRRSGNERSAQQRAARQQRSTWECLLSVSHLAPNSGLAPRSASRTMMWTGQSYDDCGQALGTTRPASQA